MGTLQLFNRKMQDVTQEDLARISHIRKLIGSTLIKCDYYAITLQTILGMNLRQRSMDVTKENVDAIQQSFQESVNQTL